MLTDHREQVQSLKTRLRDSLIVAYGEGDSLVGITRDSSLTIAEMLTRVVGSIVEGSSVTATVEVDNFTEFDIILHSGTGLPVAESARLAKEILFRTSRYVNAIHFTKPISGRRRPGSTTSEEVYRILLKREIDSVRDWSRVPTRLVEGLFAKP
jgi:hypothetical protein